MRGKSLIRKLAQTAKGAVKTLGKVLKVAAPLGIAALGGTIAYSGHKTKQHLNTLAEREPKARSSPTGRPALNIKWDDDESDSTAFKRRLDSNRSLPQPAWMSPAAQKAQTVNRNAQRVRMDRDNDAAIAGRQREFKGMSKTSAEEHALGQLREDILQQKRVTEQKLRQANRKTNRLQRRRGRKG